MNTGSDRNSAKFGADWSTVDDSKPSQVRYRIREAAAPRFHPEAMKSTAVLSSDVGGSTDGGRKRPDLANV